MPRSPDGSADRRATGRAEPGRQRGSAPAVALLLVFAAALAVAPLLVSPYWMRVLSFVFMYAVLAQGINIMAGYTGYPAFGNVAFFGLGAYATAVLMNKLAAPFAACVAAGTLLPPLLVLAVGPPLLRLRGHYFAIATLGLNEAIKQLVSNARPLTGGGMGLSLPLPPGGPVENAMFFYYLFLGTMALATWSTWEVSRRRLGAACRAIRENEEKAEAMGLHTTRVKTLAWMISAATTGLAGSIYAYWITFIDPPGVFDMAIAVKSFVIFLFGGAGTVLGPVAGAFFVEALATLTWSKLLDWHLGAMGLLIMAVVMLFPGGYLQALRRAPSLAGAWGRLRARLSARAGDGRSAGGERGAGWPRRGGSPP